MARLTLKKILAGALAAVLSCVLTSCQAKTEEEPEIILDNKEEEASYSVVEAEYGDINLAVRIACTYTPTEYEELCFAIDDRRVMQVNVKEGDIVAKGDILASLDVGDLEEEVEELEYQIRHMNLELAHIQELKDFDVTSAENLYSYTHKTAKDKEELEKKKKTLDEQYHDSVEDLEDALKFAQERLERYQEELAGSQIIAGMNGEVTYVKRSLLDSYSSKDDRVFLISNLDSSYFVARGTEYAEYFEEGESVTLSHTENGNTTYIDVTPVNMDQWQDQMLFRPTGSEIFESGLSAGFFLELDTRSHVLRIPNRALHEAEDGNFVYIFEDGLLTMRYVKTGLQGSEYTEILDGLEAGENVVLK